MTYKLFTETLRAFDIETPEAEYKFHDKRKWRFDYCFPRHKVAIEIEGGVWTRGRHTRGSGFVKDMEKYNEATRLGWRILRFTPSDLGKNATYELIKETLYGKQD